MEERRRAEDGDKLRCDVSGDGEAQVRGVAVSRVGGGPLARAGTQAERPASRRAGWQGWAGGRTKDSSLFH
jgi:hypothetical protein